MLFPLSRRRFLAGGIAMMGAGYMRPAWSKATPSNLPIPTLIDGTDGEPIDLQIRRGE